MKVIGETGATMPQALVKALKGEYDLGDTVLTIINQPDDAQKNRPELTQVFAPLAKGPKDRPENHVVVLATNFTNLGNDYFKLMGTPPGFIGHEDNPDGELGRMFAKVNVTSKGPDLFRLVGKRMVAESDVPQELHEGLVSLVCKAIDDACLPDGTMSRHLGSLVDGFLSKPVTPQWKAEILSHSPRVAAMTTAVMKSLSHGTSRKVTPPKTARFRPLRPGSMT